MKIAILGWGSLLWDHRPEFDRYHDDWMDDGPFLKLEFSRISDSRLGALTLVIDSENGTACRVAYTMSSRTDPEDAICDLRCREATVCTMIGYAFLDGSRKQARDKTSLATIQKWARPKKIDVVIWADLASNFKEKCGRPFSVEAALTYTKSLTSDAKAKAAEYVWQAPSFVSTPLRDALQQKPWFSAS